MNTNTDEKVRLQEIRNEFDAMDGLWTEIKSKNSQELKRSRQHVAYIIESAKIAEAIIVFVCSSLGVRPQTQNTGFEPDFSDYIKLAADRKIISKELRFIFDSIRRIRNKAAHRDETPKMSIFYDPLSLNRVAVVHDDIRYIVDWFFSYFLKNKYPELSLTDEVINHIPPKYDRVGGPATPPVSAPFFPSPRKKASNFPKVLIFIGFLLLLYYLILPILEHKKEIVKPSSNSHLENLNAANINSTEIKAETGPDTKEFGSMKRIAMNVLNGYYQSLINDSLNHQLYFADFIEKYKTLESSEVEQNLSFEDIVNPKTKEFLKPDFSVFLSRNLVFGGTRMGETEWRYDTLLKDFMEGEGIDSQRRIIISFTLNAQNKITTLIETEDQSGGGGS